MAWKSKTTPLIRTLKGFANKLGTFGPDYTGQNQSWIDPTGDELQKGQSYFKLRTFNTVNSPNWDVPKPRYIEIPVKWQVTRKPVLPIRKPSPRKPTLPNRRAGVSDKAWSRVERKLYARLAQWNVVDQFLQKSFETRMQRYNLRLAKHLLSQSIAYKLRGKVKRKKVGKKISSTNNPYENTSITDTQWLLSGVFHKQTAFWHRKENPFRWSVVNGPGPLIQKESRWDGNTDYIPYMGWGLEANPSLPAVTPRGDLLAIAEQKAINQFHQKVKRSEAHVGNMIAERAQTYSMLAESVGRLKNFLHSPKKSVLDYIRKPGITKKVANDFIQYCFGIEPLVGDVYSLAKAFEKHLRDDSKSDMVKVRAGGSTTDTLEYVTETDYYWEKTTVKYEARHRIMAEYRISNANTASLSQFGLLNPAEVVWEVTPWSFVIDWFLPIGQYISSLSATSGMDFRTGTASYYFKSVTHFVRKYKPGPYVDRGMICGGEITRVRTIEYKKRWVLSAPPAPTLPRFKNPFSNRHVALSMALWRQRAALPRLI